MVISDKTKSAKISGTLYVVATPIGNLQDITYRAVKVLQAVDKIAVEDTRHSKRLLVHLGICKPLISLHEHNEQGKSCKIISYLEAGESIALISDAGTPLISDPGYRIVVQAHAKNILVSPIPGPSAVICALSGSGLPTDSFIFEGFVPKKKQVKINYLQKLSKESRTMVFYESPHRIVETLEVMQSVFGENRSMALARELTKAFETILSGTLLEILSLVKADSNQQKGEMVLIVGGAKTCNLNDKHHDIVQNITPDVYNLLSALVAELPKKQAASIASKITGLNKKELYKVACDMF